MNCIYQKGNRKPFHNESMKWGRLMKNQIGRAIIIETDRHSTIDTRSIHVYDEVWKTRWYMIISVLMTNPVVMNLPSLFYWKNYPIISCQWVQVLFNSIQWWLAKDYNIIFVWLSHMIKDPLFCLITSKAISFWFVICCFGADSMILEIL